jgi:hypothetical protein
LEITGNRLLNSNVAFAFDATERACIVVTNSALANIKNNFIRSQGGTVYSSGIFTASTTVVGITGNVISNAVLQIVVPDADLSLPEIAFPWLTPAMLNSFVYGANSMGYRKNYDGTVTIQVTVSVGTDNTAAFNLPVGFRPEKFILVPSAGFFLLSTAQIQTNGDVIINFETTAPTGNSINITFEPV